MTDGITDLLLGILIMGVVIAIGFGLIMPLTNTDVLQFNSNYTDKSDTANVLVESEKNKIDSSASSWTKIYNNTEVSGFGYIQEDKDNIYLTLERVYTFPELMLLLAIQDDTMTNPNTINIRNMLSGVKNTLNGNRTEYLNITDYGIAHTNGVVNTSNLGFNKSRMVSGKVNLNGCTSVSATNTEPLLAGIFGFADNHGRYIVTEIGGPRIPVYSETRYNIGDFTINDSFDGVLAVSGNSDSPGLAEKDKLMAIDTTQKYFIKYEAQISNKILNWSESDYRNSKYCKDGWYVEVVDTDKNINTYLFYNYMLDALTKGA